MGLLALSSPQDQTRMHKQKLLRGKNRDQAPCFLPQPEPCFKKAKMFVWGSGLFAPWIFCGVISLKSKPHSRQTYALCLTNSIFILWGVGDGNWGKTGKAGRKGRVPACLGACSALMLMCPQHLRAVLVMVLYFLLRCPRDGKAQR